jgi:hypothetical protein
MVRVCAAYMDATDLLGKTFTCADSHGSSYTATLAGGDADGGCYLLVFDHVYSSAPGSTTVTITCSNTATADCLIKPYIITGQASDQSTAAHNSFSEAGTSTSTCEISLTTTQAGSAVFILGAPNNLSVPTAIAGTATDDNWDDSGVGSHGVVGRASALTVTPGATTFGWTLSPASVFGYGVLAAEVLPAVTIARVQHNSMTTTGTAGSSFAATLGSGVTAGNLLVATVTLGTNLTVTPPAGWTQAGPTETVSGSLQQQVWYLVVASGGATSWTWSWTGSHSFGWTVDEWNSPTGWPASPVDSSAGAVHSTASTAVNCGTPAATAHALELWYGVLSWADSGQTLSGITGGWTTGDTAVFTGNNTSTGFYQVAAATGTPSLAATISASRVNAGVVATFTPAAGTTVTSTGSASMASMAAAGTGTVLNPVTSAGSVSMASMAAAGSGSTSGVVTSTGSVSMAAMGAGGTGQVPVIATGSVSLAAMTVHGTGSAPVIATGSVSLATASAGGSGTVAPPVSAAGSVSMASMAAGGSGGSGTVTAVAAWTGSYAVTSGFFFPFPAARPVQVAVTNTPGDWLFALVTWRPSTAGSGASVVVADDAHNWWEPAGAPTADSGAAGVTRTALWAAPAARVANSVTGVTQVQVAATGPVLSLACTIVDFAGLLPWYQVAAITGSFANASSSLALSSAAPSARALLFAAFGSDNNGDTVTGPSGWTALTGSSATNGTDHTADIKLTPAWQVTSGTATASVSSSGSLDLSGVIAGVLVSAPQPAQPNPNWPVMITEAAIGSGVQTPPSQMTWTPLSGRSLALSITQGKQYSLGQLQAGQGTITLDDPDGALIPPGTGSYAGIDSGTPLRRRVIWPGLPGSPNLTPNYVAFSGYFRRWPWNMDEQLLRGQVQAEVSDAWAYGNGPLNSMAVEECLLDSPHSLWPLTDPPGSTGAGNLVANGAPLPLVTSKFGDGGATVTWGASSGALPGMSSAQVTASGASGGASGMFSQQLAGASLSAPGYGYALAASDPAYPPVSGGVTIEVFAQPADTATGPMAISFAAAASDSQFSLTAAVAAGSAVTLATAVGFTFPGGFTAGAVYYVLGGGTSTQLSATPGGSPVTVTSDGQGYIQVVLLWNPVILAARGINGTVAQLEIDKVAGHLILRCRPAGAVSDTLVTADSGDYRNFPVIACFSLAFTQTTWRVLVSGGEIAAASGTFSSPLPASFATACYGGVMDRVSQGLGFTGTLALAGVYPGFSPQVRALSRYSAAFNGLLNEAACDRAERLLEYAGLTGRRWLGQQAVTYEGDLLASGQDTGGQAAVSSISNVVQSTLPAYASVAPTGDITYRSKLYTWNEPVRWVLGDNTAAGEVPFKPGSMATDYDPSRVTANVQLTQLDSQAVTTPSGVMSATTMAAVASTAERQYGGAPYQQTGYLAADWSSAYNAGGSLVDLADWVQAVYARPQNRIQAVTVDAASHPQAWPFWASAAVGDMVQVNVRLPTAATTPLIALTARITQTARSSQFSQGGTSAAITATLDFAPEYNALTCDDPVRGLLNGTNVMPW